ncbi:ead/Ea22-like family protein [Escherichia coli]|nr:ead/Ea22-like family protein [Escherichia coli]HDH7708933.1 ead/Ea22-like family protein [Escherichia coli]
MSNIDKRALRHSAESIIGILENIAGFEPSDIDGDSVELRFETEDGFDTGCDVSIVDQCQKTADVVRALLDERERNQQYIKRRDQENEDIALTVGKLRVELEGKDSKIANLTAERDALREGEMGDARHSNTRAAADIYFQLVEECEIPAGGSLVEYVDDMREKLEAAEKRIAELESDSQAQKLVEAIIVAIENEQERLFDEDYLMDSKECIDVIREEVKRWNDSRTAGIRIKGE